MLFLRAWATAWLSQWLMATLPPANPRSLMPPVSANRNAASLRSNIVRKHRAQDFPHKARACGESQAERPPQQAIRRHGSAHASQIAMGPGSAAAASATMPQVAIPSPCRSTRAYAVATRTRPKTDLLQSWQHLSCLDFQQPKQSSISSGRVIPHSCIHPHRGVAYHLSRQGRNGQGP